MIYLAILADGKALFMEIFMDQAGMAREFF